jgi:hypothetical protein
MIVPVVVEGQSLRWYGRIPEIADNSIEFVQLEFRFPEDWDGMVIVAQFTQTKTYNCLLVNNRCFLPMELVAGPCEVSVFGYLNEEVTRGTTIPLKLNISRSGFVSSAETPIPPTPDLYAQLIEYFSSIAGSGGGGSGSGTINPEDIAAAVEDYLSKNPPESGEDGGYYTPAVMQPSETKLQFTFTPSKANMPTVQPVQVTLPAGTGSGGNVDFQTDETLTLKDGVLSVNTTNDMEQNNTLPITSAGVFATVGNIEALLKTI